MNKLWNLLGAVLLCVCGSASALTVTYKANDLVDTTPGEDLWEYRYTFAGTVSQFDTVQIIFDSQNYKSLNGVSAGADWFVTITQPDAGLFADGLYDALASVAPASVADEFVVEFVWLAGPAQPGSQAFRVLDGNFEQIDSDRTRAAGSPVPEPMSAALLMAMGAALLGVSRGRRAAR